MSDSKLVKDLHDIFLQCAICMDGYKSPRMLPCIHSFCLQCLEKLKHSLQNQPLSCPTCRGAVSIPDNGLKDLPSNFLLVSLMERLNLADTTASTSPACHFCQGSEAIQLCIDCNVHVCSTCKTFHNKIPDFSDHTVIPINKLADEKYMNAILATVTPRCSEHRKEKIRFYCTACSKLVCRDCTIVSHKGHDIMEAERRVDTVREQLHTALGNSEEQVKSIHQLRSNVTTLKNNIEKYVSESEQKVDEQYEKLVQSLQSDRDILKQKLDHIRKKNSAPLKDIEGEYTNWTEAMNNTRIVAKKIMEADNQWNILGMEKDITDAFSKLHEDEKALKEKHSMVQKGSIIGVKFSVPHVSAAVPRMSAAVPRMSAAVPRNSAMNPVPHMMGVPNMSAGVPNMSAAVHQRSTLITAVPQMSAVHQISAVPQIPTENKIGVITEMMGIQFPPARSMHTPITNTRVPKLHMSSGSYGGIYEGDLNW